MPRKGYRKSDPLRRCHTLKTYLTGEERARIEAAADAAGLTVAAYVRASALGSRPKAKPALANAQLIRELNAAGVNLNQIARRLNTGQEVIAHEIRGAVLAIVTLIERVL